jgi:iron complex outermembrane receptor protein
VSHWGRLGSPLKKKIVKDDRREDYNMGLHPGRSALLACAASTAALLWGAPSFAQDTNQGPSLEEVVVTARRREERLQDVPVAVTAFTPERLQQAQVTTARQLVGFTPSLNINSGNQRDFQRFAIRGQGANVGTQEGVTVYIADAPLSQYIAGGPGLYFDLENLQVLNGPQGTLFGRNSVGGAVLFTPHKPTDNNGGYIQAGYGNYANQELAGVLNVAPLPGKLALRFSADTRKRDGFTHSIFDGSQFDNINYKTYRAGVLFTPTDKISNYTIVSYTKSENNGTGIILTDVNPTGPLQAAFGAAFNLTGQLALQRQIGIRYTQGSGPHWWLTKTFFAVNTTTIELPGNLTFKNVASFQRVRASGGFDNDGTTAPGVHYIRTPYSGQGSGVGESRNEYVTEEAQLQGNWFNNKLNWVVGGFAQNTYPYGYQEARVVQFGILNVQATHFNSTSTAVFGQATLDFGLFSESLNNLKLTGGYRYSWDTRHYTHAVWQERGATRPCTAVPGNRQYPNCVAKLDAKWKKPTYTISLDYKITPDILVYATNRTGFKSGNFNPNANVLIPPSYGPEKVMDYEAGVKADFNVANMPLRTNVAVFKDLYKGIQRSTFLPNPAGGILTFQSNAAAATIKGVEVQVTARPTENLTLDVTYSYLDAKYGDYRFIDASQGNAVVNLAGKRLPFAPKNKYGINVKYDLPVPEYWGDLSVNAGVSYQGKYLITDQPQPTVYEIGGYSLWNFGVNWRNFAETPVDVEMFMTNALNKKTIAAGQVFYYSAGTSNASYVEPRMFGIRLRYHFGGE